MTSREQLSDWIDIGLHNPNIHEDRQATLYRSRGTSYGNTLGLAMIGKVGSFNTLDSKETEDWVEYLMERIFAADSAHDGVADFLEIPKELVAEIHKLSLSGISAAEIATKLRKEEI